jgi:phage tail-like protein
MDERSSTLAAPEDPYRAYNFQLIIAGVPEGHFTACGGLDVRVHPIRYREGGRGQVVRHVPGQVEYGAVTLWYGLTSSDTLWRWFEGAVKGRVERRNVSIVNVDVDGVSPLVRWDLFQAWPSAWRGADLDALSRDVAIESVTLVYDWLDRQVG